jgi:hypothetical protein
MKNIGKREILRDFNFLSEIMMSSDNTRKRLSLLDGNLQKHKEMMRFKILAVNCKKRGIELDFAPVFMTRHRNNISFYYTKEKKIFWVLEIVFVIFKGEKMEFVKEIVGPQDESNCLAGFLKDFNWNRAEVLNDLGGLFEPEKVMETGEVGLKEKPVFLIKNDYEVQEVQNNLDFTPEVREQILLKSRFVELGLKAKLRNFICNIKLNEFPTIFVVKKSKELEFKLKFRN